jgi:DNA mismatch repair protein MutS
MSTPLLKKYISYHKQLQETYHNNCVVLIMNGTFYNIYEFDCLQLQLGCVTRICKLLNLTKTRNDKHKPHSITNPIMCGIPVISLSRNLSALISHNITVAIYNTIENDSNPKEHDLYKIISPSTYIDNDSSISNNILMCIYTNSYKCIHTHKTVYSLHISHIDLSTGNNSLFERYDIISINPELIKHVQSIQPSEIITNIKIPNLNILTHHIDDNKPHYKDNTYQTSFFNKVFDNDSILNIFDYLQLEDKPDLRVSYIYLLQFAYDHDPNIINKINKPSFFNTKNHLILNSDAQYELHIFNKHKPSIFSIINKTNTKFAERELKYRLFHPIFCVDTLNKRYDNISYFESNYKEYKTLLGNIIDIEKYFRRLFIKELTPNLFANMNESFQNINIVLEKLLGEFEINNKLLSDWTDFCNMYNKNFDTDLMTNTYDFKSSFFKKGIFNEIDEIDERINDIKLSFNHVETLLENDKGVKVVFVPKEQVFKTTKKAWNSIKDENRKLNLKIGTEEVVCNLSDFVLAESKNNYVKLKCNIINSLFYKLTDYEEQISVLIKTEYNNLCDVIQDDYGHVINKIVSVLTEIDVSVCGAQVAHDYKYIKPIIYNKTSSYVIAKDIRHPIIEQINDDEEYVPNDINLNNLLLFGLNSSGKSSLLRSIGCNLILAQIGFYVPCSSFSFYPYTKLISKISNTDDLYKGQSTFISEMLDLKNILENSDCRTMVLCDELTSGTETNSSVGLVCSTILQLLSNKCSFLFTTHLHEILQFDEISKNSELVIKHFKVRMEDGKIGFDRKLKDGSGDNNYGIEIANYLDIPSDFIKTCHHFRNRFTGNNLNILENKRSRYNTKVIVDSCVMCGSNKHLHTHHIREQNEADEQGMIEHFHKNKKFNLLVVCEGCHQKIHNH